MNRHLHNNRPITILLVDDDPDCRLLIRDALDECKVRTQVFEVASGEEAIEFLLKQGDHANAPKPELIYLDIEMPGIDGIETLRRIKARKELREIPVVMMTGLCGEEEMKQAAQIGANSFTLKPAKADDFLRTVQASIHYWLTVHQYPAHHIPAEVCRR